MFSGVGHSKDGQESFMGHSRDSHTIFLGFTHSRYSQGGWALHGFSGKPWRFSRAEHSKDSQKTFWGFYEVGDSRDSHKILSRNSHEICWVFLVVFTPGILRVFLRILSGWAPQTFSAGVAKACQRTHDSLFTILWA